MAIFSPRLFKKSFSNQFVEINTFFGILGFYFHEFHNIMEKEKTCQIKGFFLINISNSIRKSLKRTGLGFFLKSEIMLLIRAIEKK